MDSFHGCYENTTHDYRHFATLYLAVRFLNLLMSSVFNYNLYLPEAALVFVFALVLVTKFQPYKQKRNNTVDVILLLTVISACISSSMYYAEPFMYPRLLNDITVGIPILIVFSYLVFLILASVLPNAIQYCKKCKTLLMSRIKKRMMQRITKETELS
jgi:hypothetical protein